MKIEHKLFAHHYLATSDKLKAYKIAYPNAGGEALKTAARRLLRKPEVQDYIERQLKEATQNVIEKERLQEQQRQEEELATLTLKRKVLLQMIKGEHKVTRHYKIKDHLEAVENDINPHALLRAIELDTKLEKNWFDRAAKKSNRAVVEEQDKESEDTGADKEEYTLPLPSLKEGHNIPLGLQAKELWEIGQEAFCEKHYGPDFMPALRAQHLQLNPHCAEEYKEKGLRVLDYVPGSDEIHRMMGYNTSAGNHDIADNENNGFGAPLVDKEIEDGQEFCPEISKNDTKRYNSEQITTPPH